MNTENGWSKIRNDIHDDPLLNKDSEYLSVWIYLLTHQAYGEYKAMFSGKVITLKEGQLLTSRAKIAKATGVSDSKIKRILNSLKNDQRIDQLTDRQQSLITLMSLGNFDQRIDQQIDQRMTNGQPTIKETENEKEKRSKREKDKEKEIYKTIKTDKNISLYNRQSTEVNCQGEVTDFSPLTEKDLDKWLEEDDGIDEWDKMQLYYKQLNSSQQENHLNSSQQENKGIGDREQGIGNKTDDIAYTNPIQQENKEIYINSPHPPSFALGEHLPQGKHHSACGGTSLSQGEYITSQDTSLFGHAPVPRIFAPVCEANPYPLSPIPYSELFDEFWKAYPKKVGKGYAFECFKKIRPSRKLVDTMLEAIEKQKKSKMWKRDSGQYIPNPSTWLNQKRWEDDLDGETDDNPFRDFKLGLEF